MGKFKWLGVAMAVVLMNFAISVQASLAVRPAAHFNVVHQSVGSLVKRYGASHVLVVFDLDDTLLTMPNDLGGTGWWDWQYHLLGKHDKQAEASNLTGLLSAQSLLFSLAKMKPTDPMVPEWLANLRNRGVPMMILTARGSDFNRVTQQQLLQAGLADDFAKDGVAVEGGEATVAGAFYPCGDSHAFSRSVAYQHGVYYASGQNKGRLLRCFIQRHVSRPESIKAVVFVDDTRKNIDDMAVAFAGSTIEGQALWFTPYLARHANAEYSAAAHRRMTAEWLQIKRGVEAVYRKQAAI